MQKSKFPTFSYEKEFQKNFSLIVGIDEVGRGAIAGPLAISGVILEPKWYAHEEIFQKLKVNDSKLLTPKKREEIVLKTKPYIIQEKTIFISNKIIDKFGISFAFYKALEKLEEFFTDLFSQKKLLFLIDYYKYKPKSKSLSSFSVERGDSLSYSIALASIYAKVKRDKFMENLSKKVKLYNWQKNKGYGTKEHKALIKKYGPSKYHRLSFLKNWL